MPQWFIKFNEDNHLVAEEQYYGYGREESDLMVFQRPCARRGLVCIVALALTGGK